MTQSRDFTLPGGMKDLVEEIHLRENEELGHQQQVRHLLRLMNHDHEMHMTRIFDLLRQHIDQDLLFSDNFELARPMVYEIVVKAWNDMLQREPIYASPRAREEIVHATIKAVERLIAMIRPRYLESRDGPSELPA